MSDTPRKGAVLSSQMVEDIKPPFNVELAKSIRGLRATCQKRAIPGDKVTAQIKCDRIDDKGVLHAELFDGVLAPEGEYTDAVIRHRFPLQLFNYDGPLDDPTAVFKSVPGTIVQDGGNIQNMILDLCILAEGMALRHPDLFGPEELPITVASTADPFRSNPALQRFKDRVKLFLLKDPNRYAVHLPFEDDPQSQRRYCITSDPVITASALAKLDAESAEFSESVHSARVIVSSDPLFDFVKRVNESALYMVNASTKYRQDVALAALKQSTILPMNSAEATQVYQQMRAKGLDEELFPSKKEKKERSDTPVFPSPISTTFDAIDETSLTRLDVSLKQVVGCNLLRNELYFALPISFGTDGGLVVRVASVPIVCFTSIPTRAAEAEFIKRFSTQGTDKKNDVGAGDGTATVVLLCNLIDPLRFLRGKMKGREADHRLLSDLSAAIYTSVLSRLISTLIVFANETYLANITPEGIAGLLDSVAEESVDAARRVVKDFLNGPQFTQIDLFGISVIVWKLGCRAEAEETLV